MGKIWKNGGVEDKFIKKLIKNGKINRFSKPSKLKVDHPEIFGDFTANVVRNHLNLLKRANGLYLEGDSEDDIDCDDIEKEVEVVKDGKTSAATGFDDSFSGFNYINHRNYPVICETYKDPETGCDKVALVLTLPAGAQNVTIEISDAGASATIKYKWVQSMYNMRELFSKMLAAKQINIHHPRVLCIKNGLEKYRPRIDAVPEASIKVMMPMTVQTSGESWSYSAVKKDDGALILMADFTAFVRVYAAKIRDVEFN